jgi:hypothetical protein
MNDNEIVYSTSTGQDVPFSACVDLEPEDHCFVCNRHTDHFAEHDALVEAGLAVYGEHGVYRTSSWDDERAESIQREEYTALYGEPYPV